jgi:hypothetical protein
MTASIDRPDFICGLTIYQCTRCMIFFNPKKDRYLIGCDYLICEPCVDEILKKADKNDS